MTKSQVIQTPVKDLAAEPARYASCLQDGSLTLLVEPPITHDRAIVKKDIFHSANGVELRNFLHRMLTNLQPTGNLLTVSPA